MERGGGTDRENQSNHDENKHERLTDWVDDIENWDTKTRRRFLAVLIATFTGVLTTSALYIQGMFEPTTQLNVDARRTGDPPVTIFVQEHEEEYRATYEDGEMLDSGSDGWEVLRTAVQEIPDGGTICVNGRYEATSAIEIDKSIRLDGYGTIIDIVDSAEFVFEIAGDERYQTQLLEGVETGAHTVELDTTSDIRQGDLLLFEDAEADGVLGRGQPPGEPHSVLEVDGSTVTLEDTVVWREGYDSGTLVYVINPIEIRCSGFILEGPSKDGPHVGIIARACRDSVFEDLQLRRFGNRAIAIEACANSRVRDCTISQSMDLDSSDGYGIQLRAGCHDIIVEGCSVKECRHPFSVTPAGAREVASRSLIVRDCFVSADGSAALNCHGGSAHDITFNECMVHTWGEAGVRTGAQKTNVSGCEFRMDGHHAVTTRNDGQEMELIVTDTDVYGASNAVELDDDGDYGFNPLWKLVHIDGLRATNCRRLLQLESGNVDRVRNLIVQNSSWDSVREAGIRIENRIDRGSITNNSFGSAPDDSHIRVRESEESDVRNLQISGNHFTQPSGSDTFIRLSHTTRCVISDNKFEADSSGRIYADGPGSTNNMIKQNTYFAPGASEDAIVSDDSSLAVDNYFFDTEGDGWS